MLDENREKVWELFRGRCLRCKQKGIAVHEIIPRSQGGTELLGVWNRCVLCAACHNWAHQVGSSVSIPVLQEVRRRYMEKMN